MRHAVGSLLFELDCRERVKIDGVGAEQEICGVVSFAVIHVGKGKEGNKVLIIAR